MRESLDFLAQYLICTFFQRGRTIILFCCDCDDDVGLCPLAVFVLVLQLLKRNLEALSTMAQGRVVILDIRVRSLPKPSQIAWGAPELVVESLESKRGKKAL